MGLIDPQTRRVTQARNRSIFIRMIPYSLRGLFGLPSCCFIAKPNYTGRLFCENTHLGRFSLAGRGMEGWFWGYPWGFSLGRPSLPAPVDAPLLPSLPFSFFQTFHPFFNKFLCLLTDLPGFSSNRWNTNKHLMDRNRDRKMSKTSQNEPVWY